MASFSFDGAIAYATTHEGPNQIWSRPSLNADSVRITSGPNHTAPSFSPDGSMLAFQSTRAGKFDIWTVSAEGGDESITKRTGADGTSGRNPAWSPKGDVIAYRKGGESPDIFLIDTSSWLEQPFEENPADEFWMEWSSDGSFLYFTSNRSGAFNVWVKPADGLAEAVSVTDYRRGAPTGLPETNTYTAFAVSAESLIVPLETRRVEIYLLEADSGAERP